jgi:PAS domain S-box-containing protein
VPPSAVPRPFPAAPADSGEGTFQTIWETDHRGMNHYQSPSWYRYVGGDPGSSFGEDWLHFFHPEDREHLKREWEKCVSSEGAYIYDVEARIRRHDGTYRWFRVQGAPERSNDGRVVKWAGTCTDIDDRRSFSTKQEPATPNKTSNEIPNGYHRAGLLQELRRFFRPGRIERRLFLIVLAGLLPLVLLSFITLLDAAHRQKRQLIDTIENMAGSILTAVDTELKVSVSALEVLAASPRLASMDLAHFRDEANKLLEQHPGWVNIVLSDKNGQQVANLKVPPGQPLPRRVEFSTVQEVVRSGKPVVGNVVLSPVLKTYAFAIIVPVKHGDDVPYVLSAVVLPAAVQGILQHQRFPQQGLASIADRNDVVVARSMDGNKWVGKKVSEELVRLLHANKGDVWPVTKTLEGVPVYTMFRRSELTGWYAAIGVPTAAVDGPINRSYGILGAAIAASAIAGLLVALLIGRTIARPMRDLEQAAFAMRRGELPQVPQSEFPEMRQIASALSAAHIEREKLLQAERDARQMAEQTSKAKDEFLAMLGHELRNPLAAISMASQILDHAGHGPAHASTIDEAKAILRRQVRNLAQLTDDLLDASRVIMGKITLDRKPADAAAIVRSALSTLEKTLDLSAYELTLSLEHVWIEVDVTRIDQVVINLLTNAVKYTPPPGRIDITLQQEAGEAVLRVRDSGMGIEPDLLPRIFDLFVQGRRSLSRSQGGLGVGLTLVRRLAELHGGRVEASSDGAGAGSEFVVRLPAIGTPERAASTDLPFPRAKRCHVVIVEDNDDVRNALRRFLEMKGHQVHEACDGLSGLEAILHGQADVALVDIGLPAMDGYDIARTVKEQAARPPRLIALTGYGSRDDIERGRQAGFDHYLVKPVDMAALDDLVSKAAASL